MQVLDGVLEAIGNTPMVRLNKLTKGMEANVLVKLEYLNPSGSLKDRMALRIIEEAEKAGIQKPGVSMVTSSSGNTGIAMAFVCAVKGYNVKVYFPEETAVLEKIGIMKRYGAEVEQIPMEYKEALELAREAGLHGARTEIPGRLKCKTEEESNPNVWWIRQFSNPANVAAQSEIGKEILKQTDGKVDVFIAAVATGGTLMGVAQALKEEVPAVRIVAVSPTAGPGWVDPLSPEAEFIPGITGGIIKEIRDSGVVDEVVHIGNEEARDMAYRLSREEGLFCGMSSGANVFVAINEARKLGKGKNVVTVLVDSGDRYLSDERFIT